MFNKVFSASIQFNEQVARPIVNTLERYILTRMTTAGLGATAAIFGVVWVSQVVTRIDFATGTGQSMGAFITLMLAISPQLMAIALPFGLLIGMVQALNALNGNAELPVMAGSGVSRWSIAKPALFLGAIASGYTLISAHFVEPYANRMKRDIIVEARSDLLTGLITAGQFRSLGRDMTIYIDSKSGGNQLNGMMMSDTRDRENELIYYARSAQATKLNGDDVLLMADGQIHRKSNSEQTLSIIRFESYAVSLAEFTSAAGRQAYKIIERPTAELLSADPNDRYLKQRALEVRGEIHRRMSDWLYPLLFSLIALALAGHPVTTRQGHVATLGLAFGAALAYRGISYYIYGESAGNPSVGAFFYAVPLVGIAASAFLYHHAIKLRVPSVSAGMHAMRRMLVRRFVHTGTA